MYTARGQDYRKRMHPSIIPIGQTEQNSCHLHITLKPIALLHFNTVCTFSVRHRQYKSNIMCYTINFFTCQRLRFSLTFA